MPKSRGGVIMNFQPSIPEFNNDKITNRNFLRNHFRASIIDPWDFFRFFSMASQYFKTNINWASVNG